MHPIRFRITRERFARLCALGVFALCAMATAWQEPVLLQRAFVLSLMLCTAAALLCAFGRVAIALLLAGGLFALLKGLSLLKLRYLDSPLMAADFVYYARTSLLDTLRHYPHLLGLSLLLAIMLPLLSWWAWQWDRPCRFIGGRKRSWSLRGVGVLVAMLAFWLCLLPSGPFAAVHARNVWDKLSDDAQLTNFFVNIRDAAIHLPTMASAADAARDWQGTEPVAAASSHAPYPDIIQVLEESTFDPSAFTACSVPACHVALFQPDARTRASGMLRVHTFGGGTWVSEFASLTGMPQDIFGPGGMYAPFALAPHVRDSLPWQLRRLGYRTVAVYPTNGSFINGRNAYRAYGFSDFFDAQQLGLDEWEESDAQMFAAVRRVYDRLKRPGQPVFVMVLTLNQHGPHDIDPRATLPPPYNHGVLHGLSAGAALNFDTYLSRLQDSDSAMRGLEHDFLDRPQPTVLLHFGDHQPSFSGLLRDLPRTLPAPLRANRDYFTYFMLKSNMGGAALPHYPALDIAFLPSEVLQAAGLPTDAYFSAERSLRARCDGRYDDCPDTALLASYHAWIFGQLHVYQ